MIFQDITIQYKNQVNHDPYSRETQVFQKYGFNLVLRSSLVVYFRPDSTLICCVFLEQVATSCFFGFGAHMVWGNFSGIFVVFQPLITHDAV